MTTLKLTPLEQAIMGAYHDRYAAHGFPSPEEIKVLERDNDGGGRLTYFDHAGVLPLRDGFIGLGIYSQFDMVGLPYGASFLLWIENGKLTHLDITPNGDVGWDGSEGDWTLLDPGPLDVAALKAGDADGAEHEQ